MLVITGWNSRIAEELRGLLDYRPQMHKMEGEEDCVRATYDALPHAERYFFCAGVLLGKSYMGMTPHERDLTWQINYLKVKDACDAIFAANDRARICVMGSESAYLGSFDEMYALSKRKLHEYVETKRLGPDQQLVCVSPHIISDAGMTTRRTDQDQLRERARAQAKRRWATSLEVAKLVHFLLYEDEGYITNTVIRMHGGGVLLK
jgi:NAD(P)-dependent dehydrogenase (short-subunit alcohol dehydrogenase family)